ncbi:MAG: hypothetical protein COA62_07360 [Rhodobiaceae bacterium]|nr:MAG: hypothetical protein COA62_07360 [Rhodobiaceae bacterium]
MAVRPETRPITIEAAGGMPNGLTGRVYRPNNGPKSTMSDTHAAQKSAGFGYFLALGCKNREIPRLQPPNLAFTTPDSLSQGGDFGAFSLVATPSWAMEFPKGRNFA